MGQNSSADWAVSGAESFLHIIHYSIHPTNHPPILRTLHWVIHPGSWSFVRGSLVRGFICPWFQSSLVRGSLVHTSNQSCIHPSNTLPRCLRPSIFPSILSYRLNTLN